MNTPAWVVIDLVPLCTALLCGCTCAVLGNLLALRRATLMADALSHSVLPGLVAGYLLAGGFAPTAMLLGGVAAGVCTAALVAWLENSARLETGAALGATFVTLFAAGVVLIHVAGLENVDLSLHHVLSGKLPTLIWFPPEGVGPLDLWNSLPPATRTAAVVAAIVGPLAWLVRKELVAATFDREFARTSGLRPRLLEFCTYAAVSAAAVASFEAMGSILVVALFACPSAAARHLAPRIRGQVLWSAALGAAIVIAGYFVAAFGPALLGAPFSLAPSGVMATLAALMLVGVGALRPRLVRAA